MGKGVLGGRRYWGEGGTEGKGGLGGRRYWGEKGVLGYWGERGYWGEGGIEGKGRVLCTHVCVFGLTLFSKEPLY